MITLPDPPLADDRVRLRPWHRDDGPSLVAAWADPTIRRWTDVPPETDLEAARRWIAGDDQRRRAHVSVDLVVCEPASPAPDRGSDAFDAAVGEVGLAGFRPGSRVAMIGYWIMDGFRGRGLATASVDLVTSWALEHLDLDALVALCHPDNAAAVAVAAGCGYLPARTAPDGRHILVRRRDAR